MHKLNSNKEQLDDKIEDDHMEGCCCVCSGNKSILNNFLLYCDGCNVVVHKGCYGIVNVNETTDWFCRRCEFKQKNEYKHEQLVISINYFLSYIV